MRVGDYELLAEIGRGAMGVVHRARSRDGRDVAVKVLIAGSAEAVARFGREQRLLASLGEAEGFVPLLDHGAEPRPFLVMPFLGGGSLRARFGRGPLAIDEAVALGKTLATSLGRAHARGIVHRDLKPENVLFTTAGEDSGAGRPLIADLGLAKHFRTDVPGASQSAVLTKQGEIHGTWGYMPPEQMRDAKEVGPRADVFALGAILYEALAGAPPFEGASMMQLVARVESGQLTPLRRVRGEVPQWLADVVHRALASRADDRFEDGAALARALEPASSSTRTVPILGALAVAAIAATALVAWPRLPASEASRAPEATRPDAPKVEPPAERRSGPPAWWTALPPTKRPGWPLPAGIVTTDRAGQYENTKDGSVLVWVPPGKGTTPSFFVGKYEVSIEQFDAFTHATGYKTFAEEKGSGRVLENRYSPLDEWPSVPGACFRAPDGPGRPVDRRWPAVHMTRRDARAYGRWAGLRLPTEEEWLHAASPAVGSRHPWGNEERPDRANLAGTGGEDDYERLAPVDAFPQSESASGARNMVGNAWELCETRDDVVSLELTRGGAWTNLLEGEGDLTDPKDRWEFSAFEPSNIVGFRVARDGR
jgi:serine/threonine protein kinase/formylglycine-generating enzyme required for sulfatase activity